MKLFSANHEPVSRARARNAALLNQLVTPGFGSLMCRRWVEGAGQLGLAFVSCGMILVWFYREMSVYYGLMFSEEKPIPGNMKIFEWGVIVFAASWLWSAVTSVSLLREASKSKLTALKNFVAPPMPKLDTGQIATALATVPQWIRQGDAIARVFQFKDFPAAMKFVNAVALAAEDAWHHPDIDIRWNKVTLVLTTHDAGGLTSKDFALAKKFDELSLR
ncbi:MAG TPA: 4a-hydroxytetrahydrobiopterin dehydratase [Candidatus Aquilonibacter sp.]|nr:4a-hydroxytetrahydrobiopterin dehydratase [Candidatus Aquilonibacter sp.]